MPLLCRNHYSCILEMAKIKLNITYIYCLKLLRCPIAKGAIWCWDLSCHLNIMPCIYVYMLQHHALCNKYIEFCHLSCLINDKNTLHWKYVCLSQLLLNPSHFHRLSLLLASSILLDNIFTHHWRPCSCWNYISMSQLQWILGIFVLLWINPGLCAI